MAKQFDVKKQHGFNAIAMLCFASLYVPIMILVIYAFNSGVSVAKFEGFSLQWFVAASENQQVRKATILSLIIALAAATIATACAVSAAIATTRNPNFRGSSVVFAVINQPLMVPEIVTAVALLIVFATVKKITGYNGLAYLIFAHSAFCIPFAFMPIRARLQGMDTALEQAAADLYAPPWATFRYVTLPLLWPGILSGFMLAFVISLDDVVITEFVKSAGQDTLPTYMLGQLRRVVTPEINAISTVLLGFSVVIVIAYTVLGRNQK